MGLLDIFGGGNKGPEGSTTVTKPPKWQEDMLKFLMQDAMRLYYGIPYTSGRRPINEMNPYWAQDLPGSPEVQSGGSATPGIQFGTTEPYYYNASTGQSMSPDQYRDLNRTMISRNGKIELVPGPVLSGGLFSNRERGRDPMTQWTLIDPTKDELYRRNQMQQSILNQGE